MRLPIKLNADYWPKTLVTFFKGQADPRGLLQADLESQSFSQAVSTLKFGKSYKTTKKNRFPLTLKNLAEIISAEPLIILDIGASDGTTSLDVMQAISFKKYYITDLNLYVYYRIAGRWTLFCNHKGQLMLAVCNQWIIYRDTKNALWPFRSVVERFFRTKKFFQSRSDERIALINPGVKAVLSERVCLAEYNAFEAWPGENADLIIAANILNHSYFSEDEIVLIMQNIKEAVKRPGLIALIDNRKVEQSSIIKVTKTSAVIVSRVGNGSDVENLMLKVLNGQ
jgi:hypothetical protein